MIKLESVDAFAAIAETGSITGAARRLAVSKSVISERLTGDPAYWEAASANQ